MNIDAKNDEKNIDEKNIDEMNQNIYDTLNGHILTMGVQQDVMQYACNNCDINLMKILIIQKGLTTFTRLLTKANINIICCVIELILDEVFINYHINRQYCEILKPKLTHDLELESSVMHDRLCDKFITKYRNAFIQIPIEYTTPIIEWMYEHYLISDNSKARIDILDYMFESGGDLKTMLNGILVYECMDDLLHFIERYKKNKMIIINAYLETPKQFRMIMLLEQHLLAYVNMVPTIRRKYNTFTQKERLLTLAPVFDEKQRYTLGAKQNMELVDKRQLLLIIGDFLG